MTLNYSREEGASDHGAGHEVGVDVELGGIDEDAGRRREGTDEEAVVGQLGRLVGRGARLETLTNSRVTSGSARLSHLGSSSLRFGSHVSQRPPLGPFFFLFSRQASAMFQDSLSFPPLEQR